MNEAICKQALETHEESLVSLDNVVGLGIVQEDETGKYDPGKNVVAVYVRKKLAKKELKKSQVVPAELEIELAGKRVSIKTKVIEQGTPEQEQMPTRESL